METSFLEALNNTGQTKDSPLSFNTWSVSYHD
jgi:hypothetical protein